jgi:hypothetical protein
MQIEKPVRVRRTWTQHIKASPEKVFPLLCPVRECDWVQGWRPTHVFAETGLAERDCVFVTADKGREAVWAYTDWDPENGRVELIKVTPGMTVGRITVRLTAEPSGTAAEITYMHTALSEEGRRFVESFTAEFYAAFMQEWEDAMNHYLETGEMRVTE